MRDERNTKFKLGKNYPKNIDNEIYYTLMGLEKTPYFSEGYTYYYNGHSCSEENLKRHMLNEEYILPSNYNKDNLKKQSISKLHELLKQNNLSVIGSKDKLVKRISENISPETLNDNEFVLTKNGREFLKENKWIDYYYNILDRYDFTEYAHHINENPKDNLIDASIKFVNEHISLAKKRNDYFAYKYSLHAKALIYLDEDDYENYFKSILTEFCFFINPVYWDNDEDYITELLDSQNIIELKDMVDYLEIDNLEEHFNKSWSELEFSEELIPKEIAFDILKKALNSENLKKLSYYLKESYLI